MLSSATWGDNGGGSIGFLRDGKPSDMNVLEDVEDVATGGGNAAIYVT